ncbi:MAG TPA: hypothetical protein P5528_10735 [Steroidobacteraceae bacterium]|nr:hypothetical protein [Steroidobacteraceae bacterium]HRX89909.1 hypothetical protein [Steroidobacteraceae bacterium]
MPIPWMTVLKVVPWTDVIRTAPQVVEAARKLWGTVSKNSQPPPGSAVAPLDTPDISRLDERLAAQESIAADLHAQMLASSELIKTLADQNSMLIARVDTHRRRIAWLITATGVLAVGLVWLAVLGQ